MSLATVARAVARTVFPPVCVGCHGLVEDDSGMEHVCRRCRAGIHFVAGPHCSTCGHPFFGELVANRVCPHCLHLSPAFREGRTAVLFSGAARSLVIELKYRGGLHVLRDIGRVLEDSHEVCDFVRGAILVPVPLHPRKQRERGFNQSALIADLLARAAGGGTTVRPLLRRVLDTRTQTAFGRDRRMRNLKNAFALDPRGSLNPASHHILVDDVFTTGSTLGGCAQVLRRAGCLNLDVVTFAHG